MKKSRNHLSLFHPHNDDDVDDTAMCRYYTLKHFCVHWHRIAFTAFSYIMKQNRRQEDD
jgi:hypothetical protein